MISPEGGELFEDALHALTQTRTKNVWLNIKDIFRPVFIGLRHKFPRFHVSQYLNIPNTTWGESQLDWDLTEWPLFFSPPGKKLMMQQKVAGQKGMMGAACSKKESLSLVDTTSTSVICPSSPRIKNRPSSPLFKGVVYVCMCSFTMFFKVQCCAKVIEHSSEGRKMGWFGGLFEAKFKIFPTVKRGGLPSPHLTPQAALPPIPPPRAKVTGHLNIQAYKQ